MAVDDPEKTERVNALDAATEAGIVLIDEEGLDALDIQRLADVMGVREMTLESYVRTRDELLERIAERALSEVPAAVPEEGPWSDRIAVAMETLLDVLRGHPGITELLLTRPIPIPALDRFREGMLSILREAGFPLKEASDALAVMTSYTL